ncbi:EAL domain-containing protein [Mycolicibacterium chubuense]|uniref:EAL domain-containing protein n=1 Tax=Mycolicibacterium chubuense TaxID=1800 RepID=UPI00138F8D35|nr:EAL domain-containing protein [Mycolicibacterium chubuense]
MTSDSAGLTSPWTPGRRQILARYVIAGVLGLWGVVTTALVFGARGPHGAPATAVSIAAALCCLLLGALWAARSQSEVVGILGAVAVAAASLSQSHAWIGLAGCFIIAVLNSFGAFLHPLRSVVAVMVIATGTAVVLGVELAQRTGDPALAIGAVAVVCALNIGLPLAVTAIASSVRMDLREVDHDGLTGLLNRRAFLREVAEITHSQTDPDAHLVLIMIDIDDFKKINDTAGHAAGDRALIDIAKTLRDEAASSAVIGRYGGEEFAIADVLIDSEAGEFAGQLCRRLAAVASPVPFTASLGWSSMGLRTIALGAEAQAINALLVCADSAMYAAKRNGGNGVRHRPAPPLGAADDFSFDVWLQRSAQLVGGAAAPDTSGAETSGAEKLLDAAVDGVGLTSVFQPIVLLADESVVGFEVLTRWPQLDDPFPPDVFARAESTGRTEELEDRCIASAFRSAVAATMSPQCWLFVNLESTVSTASAISGRDNDRLVLELTERRLLGHPGVLLNKVDTLRAQGFAIALDDVGAEPDSLALLDIIGPDIIKLEPALIGHGASNDHVRTLAAVLAHRRRTGATILVEGIETTAQLDRARALGATLGQGYRFGRPTPTPHWSENTVPWSPERVDHPPPVGSNTPFDIVVAHADVRTERKDTLVALSRYIESQAVAAANPPIVLATLQRVEHFTEATRARYRRIGAASPLVALFGERLPADLGPNLRSVALDPHDPLTAEWIVLVLGPDTSTALIAREEHGGPRADGDRYFAAALTNDRLLVTLAARSLLSRVR